MDCPIIPIFSLLKPAIWRTEKNPFSDTIFVQPVQILAFVAAFLGWILGCYVKRMEVTKRRVFKTELSSVQNFCWWMIIDDYRLFFLAVVLLCIHWVYIGGIVFCVFVCFFLIIHCGNPLLQESPAVDAVDVWDNPLMSPRRLILVAATSTQRYSEFFTPGCQLDTTR